jgi:Na+-transporting NADH:ubiquinone oxidoreductase subunit NqrF
MTQPGKSNIHWNGKTGPIEAALLHDVAGNLPDPLYYLAGPPMMVESMRETLADFGVAEHAVHSEEFYGY